MYQFLWVPTEEIACHQQRHLKQNVDNEHMI